MNFQIFKLAHFQITFAAMKPEIILLVIGLYFLLLLGISWYTSRNADSKSYFIGNKQSIWWLVALGMISDSLSGVTFISVPGNVYGDKFSYMQVVFGYVIGNFITAYVLLPLYYRLNLTSIYSYLGQRFGSTAQKTGSFYFLLSRTLGAAARLYLSAGVFTNLSFRTFWYTIPGFSHHYYRANFNLHIPWRHKIPGLDGCLTVVLSFDSFGAYPLQPLLLYQLGQCLANCRAKQF